MDDVGIEGTIHVADRLVMECQIRVSVIWPVTRPADDLPIDELRALLANNVVPLSSLLKHRMRMIAAPVGR